MNDVKKLQASSAILKKAKEFGATLSGFAGVEDLKRAPSFRIFCRVGTANTAGPPAAFRWKKITMMQ